MHQRTHKHLRQPFLTSLYVSLSFSVGVVGLAQEPTPATVETTPATVETNQGDDSDNVIDEILEADGSESLTAEAIGNDYRRPNMEFADIEPRTSEGEPGDWRVPRPSGQLGTVLQGHWVSMDENGELQGRISTINPDSLNLEPTAGLNIRFIQEGQLLASTRTDRGGRFTISGLQPGVYSVVATGPNGFLACRVTVLRSKREIELSQDSKTPFRFAYFQEDVVESELRIDAAALPPTFRTVRNLAERYYEDVRLSEVDFQKYEQVVQKDIDRGAAGAESAAGPQARRGREQLELETPAAIPAMKVFPVPLTPDGRFVGRLHGIQAESGRPVMIRRANVFVVKNDRIVDQTIVDERGVFEFQGLAPGAYGLIAAGQDGFGAGGFELARIVPTQDARRLMPEGKKNRNLRFGTWQASKRKSVFRFASSAIRFAQLSGDDLNLSDNEVLDAVDPPNNGEPTSDDTLTLDRDLNGVDDTDNEPDAGTLVPADGNVGPAPAVVRIPPSPAPCSLSMIDDVRDIRAAFAPTVVGGGLAGGGAGFFAPPVGAAVGGTSGPGAGGGGPRRGLRAIGVLATIPAIIALSNDNEDQLISPFTP